MWDERYSGHDYFYGTAPSQFLQKHASWLKPGMRALVIADGEGRNSVFMAERGMDVAAMDNSPVGLEKARRLARVRGVEVDFHLADLRSWDWEPARFDLVAAIFIQFADPAFRSRIFDGIERTLKANGILMLHGYTTRQLGYGTGGPKDPEALYTSEMLMARFGDWKIEAFAEYDAELQEGAGHSGPSALIDLIARRPARAGAP
jgi:cyclopropane fatty-acyl-phospholipid synthase-like methyltransferase